MNVFYRLYLIITDYPLYRMMNKIRWESEIDELASNLQPLKTNIMSNNQETRTVPMHKLQDAANTLRMVSNTLGSTKRETCLDRNIMRSWNEIVDAINNHEPTSSERLSYYMRAGQHPGIVEYPEDTHISTVQDCELAVRETEKRAVTVLQTVLEGWVRGGDSDCIIAEFEEKLKMKP